MCSIFIRGGFVCPKRTQHPCRCTVWMLSIPLKSIMAFFSDFGSGARIKEVGEWQIGGDLSGAAPSEPTGTF